MAAYEIKWNKTQNDDILVAQNQVLKPKTQDLDTNRYVLIYQNDHC